MSTTAVARPKKQPSPSGLDPKTIAFRTSGEYAAWVDRLARANRSGVAVLLDQALAKYAEVIGFDEEPPQR